ncbi:hypothetical protein MK489_19265 [Myxococcota bacterium]|nr:hypothetical protein [Myxococcota bacterium]
MVIRVLSFLPGLIFLVSGIRWIFDPTNAAQELGMDLLTGIGASTQIGDIGAFFVSGAVMIGLAQRHGQSHWFYPAALLVGSAAGMRTLAYGLGHADFATRFIVAEVVMAAILLAAAKSRAHEV